MAQIRLLVILQAFAESAGYLHRPILLFHPLLFHPPFLPLPPLAFCSSPAFLQVMLNAMYVSIWIG